MNMNKKGLISVISVVNVLVSSYTTSSSKKQKCVTRFEKVSSCLNQSTYGGQNTETGKVHNVVLNKNTCRYVYQD